MWPFALKVDAVPWENLSAEDRATIEAMGVEAAKLSSGGETEPQRVCGNGEAGTAGDDVAVMSDRRGRLRLQAADGFCSCNFTALWGSFCRARPGDVAPQVLKLSALSGGTALQQFKYGPMHISTVVQHTGSPPAAGPRACALRRCGC